MFDRGQIQARRYEHDERAGLAAWRSIRHELNAAW
jgi:hypothetical protein